MRAAWAYLKRVPAAVWAALAAAGAVLVLYLRGRRLEAELARAKVREQAARAAAVGARSQGRREVLEVQADEAAAEAAELEAEAQRLEAEGGRERARIESLGPSELHNEYLELARRARARAHGGGHGSR